MSSSRAALTMLSPCIIAAAQPAKATFTKSSTRLRLLTRPSRQILPASRPFHHVATSPIIAIAQPHLKRIQQQQQQQQQQSRSISYTHHRLQNQPASPPSTSSQQQGEPTRPSDRPSYELRFTCKPCGHRSSHIISKQGYHHGSVLISCPSCRNRHIISDHLKIFGDKAVTIEDILREKGQLVKKGTLGEDEDVEFWEDGTITERHAELCQEEKDRLEKYRKDKEAGLTGDLEGKAPGASFRVGRVGEKKGDGEV